MKKSILFGALAFFAIGAMSIQNAEAQEPVKNNKTQMQEVSIEKKTVKPAAEKQEAKKAEAKAEKKVEMKHVGDCCAEKKCNDAKAEKKDGCCAEKKCKDGKKHHDCDKRKAEKAEQEHSEKKAEKSNMEK